MQFRRATPLRRELDRRRELESHIRRRLYDIPLPGIRFEVAKGLAAAAAERTFALLSGHPDLQNDTSREWRAHLDDVWAYLAGDSEKYYVLSRLLASFLLSPLNHIEGQDGPDHFDRPQTVASYCAVTAAVIGVCDIDNAAQAVNQIFEAVDLGDQFESNAWSTACDAERRRVKQWLDQLLDEAKPGDRLSDGLIATLRRNDSPGA